MPPRRTKAQIEADKAAEQEAEQQRLVQQQHQINNQQHLTVQQRTTAEIEQLRFQLYGNNKLFKKPPSDDTIRLLITSDNHLGYAEDDVIRSEDSFRTFEECLMIGKQTHCDLFLFGGDLFHDNKPSRNTLLRTTQLLRHYCCGEQPPTVKMLTDEAQHFTDGTANFNSTGNDFSAYKDTFSPSNISIPAFTIHGNHDDPTGNPAISALDILHEAKLINYFGKHQNIDELIINPIVLQKSQTLLALYGIGNLRDERMANIFTNNLIKFKQFSLSKYIQQNEMLLNKYYITTLHQNYTPQIEAILAELDEDDEDNQLVVEDLIFQQQRFDDINLNYLHFRQRALKKYFLSQQQEQHESDDDDLFDDNNSNTGVAASQINHQPVSSQSARNANQIKEQVSIYLKNIIKNKLSQINMPKLNTRQLPDGIDNTIFHLPIVHQNRCTSCLKGDIVDAFTEHGKTKNTIHPLSFPPWADLILWGHEHCCFPQVLEVKPTPSRIQLQRQIRQKQIELKKKEKREEKIIAKKQKKKQELIIALRTKYAEKGHGKEVNNNNSSDDEDAKLFNIKKEMVDNDELDDDKKQKQNKPQRGKNSKQSIMNDESDNDNDNVDNNVDPYANMTLSELEDLQPASIIISDVSDIDLSDLDSEFSDLDSDDDNDDGAGQIDTLQSTMRVLQPGSTVITSLCPGESYQKHCFILEIRGADYRLTPIRLATSRQFLIQDFHIDQQQLKILYNSLKLRQERLNAQLRAQWEEQQKQKAAEKGNSTGTGVKRGRGATNKNQLINFDNNTDNFMQDTSIFNAVFNPYTNILIYQIRQLIATLPPYPTRQFLPPLMISDKFITDHPTLRLDMVLALPLIRLRITYQQWKDRHLLYQFFSGLVANPNDIVLIVKPKKVKKTRQTKVNRAGVLYLNANRSTVVLDDQTVLDKDGKISEAALSELIHDKEQQKLYKELLSRQNTGDGKDDLNFSEIDDINAMFSGLDGDGNGDLPDSINGTVGGGQGGNKSSQGGVNTSINDIPNIFLKKLHHDCDLLKVIKHDHILDALQQYIANRDIGVGYKTTGLEGIFTTSVNDFEDLLQDFLTTNYQEQLLQYVSTTEGMPSIDEITKDPTLLGNILLPPPTSLLEEQDAAIIALDQDDNDNDNGNMKQLKQQKQKDKRGKNRANVNINDDDDDDDGEDDDSNKNNNKKNTKFSRNFNEKFFKKYVEDVEEMNNKFDIKHFTGKDSSDDDDTSDDDNEKRKSQNKNKKKQQHDTDDDDDDDQVVGNKNKKKQRKFDLNSDDDEVVGENYANQLVQKTIIGDLSRLIDAANQDYRDMDDNDQNHDGDDDSIEKRGVKRIKKELLDSDEEHLGKHKVQLDPLPKTNKTNKNSQNSQKEQQQSSRSQRQVKKEMVDDSDDDDSDDDDSDDHDSDDDDSSDESPAPQPPPARRGRPPSGTAKVKAETKSTPTRSSARNKKKIADSDDDDDDKIELPPGVAVPIVGMSSKRSTAAKTNQKNTVPSSIRSNTVQQRRVLRDSDEDDDGHIIPTRGSTRTTTNTRRGGAQDNIYERTGCGHDPSKEGLVYSQQEKESLVREIRGSTTTLATRATATSSRRKQAGGDVIELSD